MFNSKRINLNSRRTYEGLADCGTTSSGKRAPHPRVVAKEDSNGIRCRARANRVVADRSRHWFSKPGSLRFRSKRPLQFSRSSIPCRVLSNSHYTQNAGNFRAYRAKKPWDYPEHGKANLAPIGFLGCRKFMMVQKCRFLVYNGTCTALQVSVSTGRHIEHLCRSYGVI